MAALIGLAAGRCGPIIWRFQLKPPDDQPSHK